MTELNLVFEAVGSLEAIKQFLFTKLDKHVFCWAHLAYTRSILLFNISYAQIYTFYAVS